MTRPQGIPVRQGGEDVNRSVRKYPLAMTTAMTMMPAVRLPSRCGLGDAQGRAAAGAAGALSGSGCRDDGAASGAPKLHGCVIDQRPAGLSGPALWGQLARATKATSARAAVTPTGPVMVSTSRVQRMRAASARA